MGSRNLIPVPSVGDWNEVRRAFEKLNFVLGIESTPTFSDVSVADDLTVTGDATIGGSLSLTGALTLDGLSASRLVATNASKELVSSDLVGWITGTANRVTVSDDGDGTITLSGPQDIHTGATPTFDDLTLSTPLNIYALSHDSFAGFVADEHVAHSGISIIAGTGLTGGGTIDGNVTLNCSITQYTDEAAQDAVGGILDDGTVGNIVFTYDDVGGVISAVTQDGEIDHDSLLNTHNLTTDIDHDQLTNFVANEHIDHTSVTLTAGTGLTGGGDISANRTFAVDGVLEDLDTLGAASADGEFIVATAAGVFAYESGNTARTSLGLGTGDSPTFTDLTLSTPSNIYGLSHDSFTDFVANEHINHTSVTLTAGSGLTGGGDISASRSFALDINGLTEDTTPDTISDYVATYDTSATANKKVKLNRIGPGGTEYSNNTINLYTSESAAEKQAKIDAVGKYIDTGVAVTFQFENGTHTHSDVLTFSGFWGGGSIYIYGDTSETNATDLHTSQNVHIDCSSNYCDGIYVGRCTCNVRVWNLKVSLNTASGVYDGITVASCFSCFVYYNYVTGNSDTQGYAFRANVGFYTLRENYVSNIQYGIAVTNAVVYSNTNDDTGTAPEYGLWARDAAYIGKNSTQPAGSVSNELTSGGSTIN